MPKTYASMTTVALFAALERAFDAALALDPDTAERVAALEGRVIAVEVTGLGLRLVLRPGREGVGVSGHYDGPVDTTLRGSPLALLRMGGTQPSKGLFNGEVVIEGDVELGQRMRRILDQADIDWEEHLSRLTGDAVAHGIGNAVRGLGAWGLGVMDNLRRDTAEYLQEETDFLPSRGEVAEFLAEVDTVRDDVERLAARLRRAQDRLA